ncbi:hypothetical protein D3C76_1472700 [compost metagenome]
MKVGPLLGMFMVIAAVVGTTGSALADHRRDRGDRDWVDEYRDGPCRVRIEASREVYRKEVTCRGRHYD